MTLQTNFADVKRNSIPRTIYPLSLEGEADSAPSPHNLRLRNNNNKKNENKENGLAIPCFFHYGTWHVSAEVGLPFDHMPKLYVA